jgi:hypothetical protein
MDTPMSMGRGQTKQNAGIQVLNGSLILSVRIFHTKANNTESIVQNMTKWSIKINLLVEAIRMSAAWITEGSKHKL